MCIFVAGLFGSINALTLVVNSPELILKVATKYGFPSFRAMNVPRGDGVNFVEQHDICCPISPYLSRKYDRYYNSFASVYAFAINCRYIN